MSRRILIVDDDVDLVELYVLYMDMSGHDVQGVHDAAAALTLLKFWKPDVMLLDVRMPGMDGLELVRTLRADGHCFPICLHSESDDAAAREMVSTEDVQGMILKPMAPVDVLMHLETAVMIADLTTGTGREAQR